MTQLQFPRGFVWGAATSSYQIEGAVNEDGRSESIWDRFSHTPGKIQDGTNGDVTCDHYHRWQDDIKLMKELGLQGYRFSIAWPRILPNGRGAINQPGIDFYSRLVDGLLEAGITPFATLYHWDLPQVLQDAGGWPNRATAEAFVEYADVTSRALGDRVKHWITHNEPWCASFLAYQIGEHAPGWHDWPAALAASHHLLLSHGWAVPVLRENSPGAEVGITLNFTPATPASDAPADVAAAHAFEGYFNRWFTDPLYRGAYPADMIAAYTAQGFLPATGPEFIHERDLAAIAVPTDFLGVNYYTRAIIGAGDIDMSAGAAGAAPVVASENKTEMDWEVYPQGLHDLLMWLHDEYKPAKMYVTENGASYSDGPDAKGQIHDERRRTYLRDHFAAAKQALDDGVPLAGYFVWSLMDNFEWGKGFTQRFGVVWTDYETQQRLPKASALWYRQVIADNGFDSEK